MCFLQGSLRQDSSPLVHQTGNKGVSAGGVSSSGVHQGKEWEYSVPLIGPCGQMQASRIPDTWTIIIVVYRTDIGVNSDEQVLSTSLPGPIKSKDIVHVALAAEAQEARLSNGPSPLVPAVLVGEGMHGSEELQVFSYLQLAPPHCHSCRC